MTFRVVATAFVGIACLLSQGPILAQLRDAPSSASPLAAVSQPPANVADLVLLLHSYTPDRERIVRLRAEMNAPAAATGDPAQLAIAWHQKAIAAQELQELDNATNFLEKALAHARLARNANPNQVGGYFRIRSEYAHSLLHTQGTAASMDSFQAFARELEGSQQAAPGYLLGVYVAIANHYIHFGDMQSARDTLARLDAYFKTLSGRPPLALVLSHFSQQIEGVRGFLFSQEGRFADAQNAYLAAIRQQEQSMANNPVRASLGLYAPPLDHLHRANDSHRILLAHTLINLQRLDESELLLREVLKGALVRDGRNSVLVGRALFTLARVLFERGRYPEAAVVAEWSDKTLEEAGLSETSTSRIRARITLVDTLTAAGRAPQAVAIIDSLRQTLGADSRLEDGFGRGTLSSIRAYMQSSRLLDALRDSDRLLKYAVTNFKDDHYRTAEVRGYRAMVLRRLGRLDEARREFGAAIPVLLESSNAMNRQQTSVARTTRLRFILEDGLHLLVGAKGTRTAKDIAEAFVLADVARWQSVQKAVTGSALRLAAGTPELGMQIRTMQDSEDELQAVYKNLISLRSAPPDRQLPGVIQTMEARIATLRANQQRSLTEIRQQFPQYDTLVNPRPTTFVQSRKALQPNEALLSIYVTARGSYVWASGPDGALRFHFSDRNSTWVADRVRRLRQSVDLTTGISPGRMPFDLEAGSSLYQALLAPVEAAWSKADTLLVVANDTLGQIPFSMLPTQGARPVSTEPGAAQAQLRSTAWLARKVAIAYLPSVSSLVTLRGLPAAKTARKAFIGFGDPDFGLSTDTPAAPGTGLGTRRLIRHLSAPQERWSGADQVPAAVPVVRQATLLEPLPDTRDEIQAIAAALTADPRVDTFFGAQASRQNVLGTNLNDRRVLAFATHGLVAGDLPGLDQPALALASGAGQPISAGLLTLEDVLKLQLDADLVVLSACNTAAPDGSAAEAISGLGRGFFHAGARAVLATHWSVETVSARLLVTHLFERYARDAGVSRAHALRLAMVDVMDAEATGTYAHPAFWAPYALYGDPGR
ncbi:MAG: CHAT domain-containing tetratricopeptide repeat protein [Rhodoferax sp.]